MPGSIVVSGGSGGVSAKSVELGINQSADFDTLLARVDEIKDCLLTLATRTTSIPQLYPAIAGAENTTIETPIIPPPALGRCLIIQFMGWYSGTPQNGLIQIMGTDGQIYLRTPIIAAKAGLVLKARLPESVGCQIALSAGGIGISGFLNYASTTDFSNP